MANNGVAKYLGGSHNELPHSIRVTPDGKMVSVIDIIMVVSFTDDHGELTNSARTNAATYLKRLISEHHEVTTWCVTFKFQGRGQQPTPVTARSGVLKIIQLLRGKKAAKFRENVAELVEKYIDADMGLADDITDRALAAHMADLDAREASDAKRETGGEQPHKRIESRDTTKLMCQAVKEAGVPPKYFGLMNGGVNHAITGMPTKVYRGVQVNLQKEAAREAFTESMLHMTGTINCVVRDQLAEGGTVDDQLKFMREKCAAAAELLGLHKKAKEVVPREYIVGNKRVMSAALAADKRARLQQPAAVPALA
ncbi:hypothetical protein WJX84_007949 [Apatococcus fuscideae]|uniref:Uncharacterized protein n=1 Tax=Apatococcus fuscideae TaxID=2026836 RepID=A0AAW1T7B4_9CHLO